MPRGRKSEYNDAIAQDICTLITEGKSLVTICEQDDMPSMSTVFKWLSQNSDFAEKYAHAREVQADVMDAEILKVAREVTNEDAQAARVKIDAFKWRASKLAPKKYGDRQEIDLNVNMDPEQAKARLAELLGKASGNDTGN